MSRSTDEIRPGKLSEARRALAEIPPGQHLALLDLNPAEQAVLAEEALDLLAELENEDNEEEH